MDRQLHIFAIYSLQDKDIVLPLLANLKPLQKEFNVSVWQDDPIQPGQVWKPQFQSRLHETDIFLLLVSNAFMHSEFVKQLEFKTVIDRYKAGTSTVIPIILENCPWNIDFEADEYTFNFKELQVLPGAGKPMKDWDSIEQANTDVTVSIKAVISLLSGDVALEESKKDEEAKVEIANSEEQIVLRFKEENEAEEEKRSKEEVEAQRIAGENRRKVEAEVKNRAEEEKRDKEDVESQKIAVENRRKEEAEAKKRAEEVKRGKEKVESQRIAGENSRKEEAEAKNRIEEEKRLREIAASKRRAEEQRRTDEAETRRLAKERRLKEEAEVKIQAERQRRREEENRQELAAEPNREDEKTQFTIGTDLKKRLVLGFLIVVIAIIGIWAFSKFSTVAEQQPSPSQASDSIVVKDSVIPDKIEIAVPKEEVLSKLAVGDTYDNGFVFEIDADGNTGKIAHIDDAGPMPWTNALNIHEQLGEGWRLPTFDELLLMRKSIGQGATNNGEFSDGLYWSATDYDEYQARLVRFRDGNTSYHYNKEAEHRKFRVRAIRNFNR